MRAPGPASWHRSTGGAVRSPSTTCPRPRTARCTWPAPSSTRTGPRPRASGRRVPGRESDPGRTCMPGCPSRASFPVIASTARDARFAAALRPYRRAHSDVRISATSRTRSSSTSDGSATMRRRPCAVSAASTYSAPNRANLSRRSTAITLTDGSRSRARNLRAGTGSFPASYQRRAVVYDTPAETAHSLRINEHYRRLLDAKGHQSDSSCNP